MSNLSSARLFFHIEKLKIGGLKHEQFGSEYNNGLRFIPNNNPESPRDRKNELSKLEDIKNTQRIDAVVRQGKYYDQQALTEIRKRLREN